MKRCQDLQSSSIILLLEQLVMMLKMLPFQLDLLMLLIKMAQHLKFSSSHEVVHKLFDNEWGHSGICYYSR